MLVTILDQNHLKTNLFWDCDPPAHGFNLGGSKNTGTPKWMVYNGKPGENPIKMDDLGVPLFLETPICFAPQKCLLCPEVSDRLIGACGGRLHQNRRRKDDWKVTPPKFNSSPPDNAKVGSWKTVFCLSYWVSFGHGFPGV